MYLICIVLCHIRILYHNGNLRVHAYGDHAYLVSSNYLSRQSLAKMSNIRVLYWFLYSVFLRISYRRPGVHRGPAAYLIHSCNCLCCVRELRFLAGRNQSSNFGYDANPRSWNWAGRFQTRSRSQFFFFFVFQENFAAATKRWCIATPENHGPKNL